MKLSRRVPAVLSAAIVVAGIFVYFIEIPTHKVERTRLSRLVVTAAPSGFTQKPTSSSEEPATSVPFSAFQSAYTKLPNSTGAWSIVWTGSKSSNDVASLLTLMLPSKSDAASVLSEVAQYYVGKDSLKSRDYKYIGSFSAPSVSGAQAAVFRPSKGTTGDLAVIVFQDGRYVSVTFASESKVAAAESVATPLAADERSHLRSVGSGFSLRLTHWPLVASLVFWAVSAALAMLVIVVPAGWRRARRRRREAREIETRRAIQMRGAKNLKRRGARAR